MHCIIVPFANGRGRRMSFLVDEEIDGSESPQALPETGPVIVDLTGEDRCSTPSLLSMETIKRVRPSLQLPEPSPATPAGTLRSTRKRARSTSQKSADSRSSSPEMSHRTSRRACREASNTANSAKAAKPYLKKPPVDYPTFRSRRAGLKKSMPKCLLVRPAGLKNPKPKSLLPVLESRGTTPGDSVDAQLPPAPLPPAPEPQASQPKPSPSKDVIFHFFLANEDHGAIPQPFEHCGTMSSFFDEALAAWGALGEDQPQPRMAAVKVIMEGIGRPTVVLWRNKEGFSRMMDMVLEQAAEKQTKFNVEVRCFKRG